MTRMKMTETSVLIACITLVCLVAMFVLGRSLRAASDANTRLSVDLMWRLREAHDVIVTAKRDQIERQKVMRAFATGENAPHPTVYTSAQPSRLEDEDYD